MAENFDKLRAQRKFTRQSFWSRLGLNFSSPKDSENKKPKLSLDTSNADRKKRMKEVRMEEIDFLEQELKKETAKSKGVPSVKMMNLNRQIQVLKAYNEAVDDFGEKYRTLGEAKKAVKEKRNKERELYLKDQVFEEKYKFFLRIQDLQKALREFEETASRVFLDFRHNGNPESEKFYEELRSEIGKIETELQTLEIDNPIEFRSAYLLSLSEDLKKEGHIAQVESVQQYLEQIKIRMTIGKPMFLHGPTGTGKTSLARFASKELTGKNPEIIYCNPQTRESNIYGRTGISVEDGASKTFFDFGPLARAMQNGSICIFDEFTALPKDQMSMIKGIMNAKVGDIVTIPGNGSIKIQTGFQLIFTANLKSEKNLERNDLPPEVANEFAQNNLEINYTQPIEAYDIFLSRIVNERGETEFSRYDLEETVPNLLKAMKDIQDGYNGVMSQEVAALSGVGDLGKVKALKKLVMNQRTIENIIEGWKVVSKKQKNISFVEFLDERLATELNFGEYKEDKLFVAKILASHGLLRTLNLEDDIKIPESELSVSNWTEIKSQELQASQKREVLNIKQLSELDPFEIKKKKATKQVDEVMDEVLKGEEENGVVTNGSENFKGQKTETQLNSERDFLIKVAKSNWSQSYPARPVEKFTLETFDFKSKITSDQGKAGEVTHLNQPTPKDLENLFKKVKPEIFNPNTDQAFIQWRDKERVKTKVTGTTKRYEFAEYTAKVLSKKYYIPGFDYWKWIQENPNNPNLANIKDGSWYYTPSSLFRASLGVCLVPLVSWGGSEFEPGGVWLGNDVPSRDRVLLLPRR